MLAVSMLPNAIWHEVTGGASARWLFWAKMGLMVILIITMLVWNQLRPLLHFVIILAGVYAFEEIFSWLTGSALWNSWFGGTGAPFSQGMLGIQLGRLLVSLLVIGLLLVMGYRWRHFFLVRGELDTPIEPVRWLGFSKPIPWTKFGGQFTVYISLG